MNIPSSSRSTFIHRLLFGLAFILALTLRFLHLGANPLTDSEAKWALQALEISRGGHPVLGGQPGYLVLTAVNFFIFGGSNFLVRLWPALVGSALTLVPVAFQKKLGLKAAIILSFALALEPGLLSISRTVGSPILAIGFTSMCLAAWYTKRSRLAGFFGGMALLSGPAIWFGLMGLGISFLLIKFIPTFRSNKTRGTDEQISDISPLGNFERNKENVEEFSSIDNSFPIRTALIWGIVTIILAGTMFFMVPAGLSALAGSLVEFLRGWGTVFLITPGFLVTALFIYSLMPLVFFGSHFSSRRFNQDPISIKTLVVTLILLLLALIYPAHHVSDLAWMLIPLWIVAAIEISHILVFVDNQKLGVAIAGVITLAFFVFFWQNLISLPNMVNNSIPLGTPILLSIQKYLQSLGLLVNGMLLIRILIWVGALLLVVMSLLLVSAIWDKKVAKAGSTWGILVALLLYTISAGVGAAGLRILVSAELWQPGPQFAQADLLETTVRDLSEWKTGHTDSLDISILTDFYPPQVAWLLRDWHVTAVDSLSPASSPALIILPEGMEATLSSPYRKQVFIYTITPLWNGISMNDWLKWLTIREIPEQKVNLVLWARDDLFSDAGLGASSTAP